ncbi:hypothetical protein BCR37DRAFT_388468 [Protomyces lactucae-debilis]|uniref:Ser-Thr-rich glycosyl-phosphatidyl-inositol-anchored membrane family-domain-containing protein n=1 Tax=Protomyces lactucae-debilis TaxID=2754530 RepID=A0A1Y2F6H7_PROLT|nr:uncharacterized protein BCR37DRAFT_388468 [Protomyces lactucae-debilis]ORY79449.1 hypothetical protein BCR37DRAFT_388468 [Protomyces lactucae-debilis]
MLVSILPLSLTAILSVSALTIEEPNAKSKISKDSEFTFQWTKEGSEDFKTFVVNYKAKNSNEILGTMTPVNLDGNPQKQGISLSGSVFNAFNFKDYIIVAQANNSAGKLVDVAESSLFRVFNTKAEAATFTGLTPDEIKKNTPSTSATTSPSAISTTDVDSSEPTGTSTALSGSTTRGLNSLRSPTPSSLSSTITSKSAASIVQAGTALLAGSLLLAASLI